jgi:hypothetical protein
LARSATFIGEDPCWRFVGAFSGDVKQWPDWAPLTEAAGRRRAGKYVGTILHGYCAAIATKGPRKGFAMLTMGIGLIAGVFYWLASYKLAFWIVVYAIIYGGLGILRGDNHTRPVFRGDSEFTVALLMPVAWHVGTLAGYL